MFPAQGPWTVAQHLHNIGTTLHGSNGGEKALFAQSFICSFWSRQNFRKAPLGQKVSTIYFVADCSF